MFGRKNKPSAAEVVNRTAQGVRQAVAGDRGFDALNKVTRALGLGHLETCDDPKCTACN
ncbi:hypothetical protein ACWGDX_13220 [Streptomyces sp. NPDC055025]